MSSKSDILKNENFVLNFIKDHSDDASFVSKLKAVVNAIKSDDSELPKWQQTELDKRLDAYKKKPNNVMDWEDIKSQLLSR